MQPSTIEIAAIGSPEEVNAMSQRLARSSSRRRGTAGPPDHGRRSRVLGKTRATLLAAAILIILTAALCVLPR